MTHCRHACLYSGLPEITKAQTMCRRINASKQMAAVVGTHVVYPLIEVQDGQC